MPPRDHMTAGPMAAPAAPRPAAPPLTRPAAPPRRAPPRSTATPRPPRRHRTAPPRRARRPCCGTDPGPAAPPRSPPPPRAAPRRGASAGAEPHGWHGGRNAVLPRHGSCKSPACDKCGDKRLRDLLMRIKGNQGRSIKASSACLGYLVIFLLLKLFQELYPLLPRTGRYFINKSIETL